MRRYFKTLLASLDWFVIDAQLSCAFVGFRAIHIDDFNTQPGDGIAEAIAVAVRGDDRPETGRVVVVGTTEFSHHQRLPAFGGALAHQLLRVAAAHAGTGGQREGDTKRCAVGRPARTVVPCRVEEVALMSLRLDFDDLHFVLTT